VSCKNKDELKLRSREVDENLNSVVEGESSPNTNTSLCSTPSPAPHAMDGIQVFTTYNVDRLYSLGAFSSKTQQLLNLPPPHWHIFSSL